MSDGGMFSGASPSRTRCARNPTGRPDAPARYGIALGVSIVVGNQKCAIGLQPTDPDEVYVVYRDERREWEAALPALRRMREEKGWRYLAENSGLSERAIRYALNGGMMPHRRARERLVALNARRVGGPSSARRRET